MYNLPDLISQCAALLQPLDPRLHDLLSGRIDDAVALGLDDCTHFVVVHARILGRTTGIGCPDLNRVKAFWSNERWKTRFRRAWEVGGALPISLLASRHKA